MHLYDIDQILIAQHQRKVHGRQSTVAVLVRVCSSSQEELHLDFVAAHLDRLVQGSHTTHILLVGVRTLWEGSYMMSAKGEVEVAKE